MNDAVHALEERGEAFESERDLGGHEFEVAAAAVLEIPELVGQR